jgi:ubiquinone/menaquinone biosynthesis C-methylase UbiE
MNCGKYYDTIGELGILPRDIIRFNQTLNHVLPEGTLLDIGCGEGYWLKLLKEKTNLQLMGADVSEKRIEICRKKLNDPNIPLFVKNIETLDFKDKSIDQITSMETLEHTVDWEKGLKEIMRIAKKKVIITVPYDEKLTSKKCSCGGEANLYGHLHSFNETSFLGLEGDVRIHKMSCNLSINYYVCKAYSLLKSKFKPETKKSSQFICSSCYKELDYSGKAHSVIKRLEQIIKNKPQYLLVEIDL